MAVTPSLDFRGKHLLVYRTNCPSQEAMLVQDARFEVQEGRLFLVGRVSEAVAPNTWSRGLPICIAWDSVDQYLIYASAEEFRQRNLGMGSREDAQENLAGAENPDLL